MLEYGKNEKLKIEKTPEAEMRLKKIEKPSRITLKEVIQYADDEYIWFKNLFFIIQSNKLI